MKNTLSLTLTALLFLQPLAALEEEEPSISALMEEAQKRLEDQDQEQPSYVSIGTRSATPEEQEEFRKERLSHCNDHKKVAKALSFQLNTEGVKPREVLYSSHPGVFYHPVAMLYNNEQVTLHDGSIWTVKYEDRGKMMNWLVNDNLILVVNDAWFSHYQFKLINQTTEDRVEVNLLRGPLYNGLYSYWILGIDYYNQQIILNDQSVWYVASYSALKKWLPNDTLIIGIDDSWFSNYPNVLINAKMSVLNFSPANCLELRL